MKSGLVSVTFRKLTPATIVKLVKEAGLQGIEWGGDIHVPHGDLAKAQEAAALTADAGLECAAYGSYYRVGVSENAGLKFADVLATAQTLGAPTIRVWMGNKGSAETSPAERAAIVADAMRIGKMAADAGLSVALEYHGSTLTDEFPSVKQLFAELSIPALKFMWQPPWFRDAATHLAELEFVCPRLANLHVFEWMKNSDGGCSVFPLADGAAHWPQYLQAAAPAAGWALLEFVKDERTEQFAADALTLRTWLNT